MNEVSEMDLSVLLRKNRIRYKYIGITNCCLQWYSFHAIPKVVVAGFSYWLGNGNCFVVIKRKDMDAFV